MEITVYVDELIDHVESKKLVFWDPVSCAIILDLESIFAVNSLHTIYGCE